MINLYIPSSVKSDVEGYTFLGNLLNNTMDFENEEIYIDFSECDWFEANLCAVLGSIMNNLIDKGNKVKMINLKPRQQEILGRNNFLTQFGFPAVKDVRGTTVGYCKFKISEERAIKDYIGKELMDKPDMPTVSKALRTEIIRSIFEIYSNAITHGACTHVFSCGQYYPGKEPPYMYFTIVDVGRTIKHNVSLHLKDSSISGSASIEWALKEGNTTKTGPHPGGLGLALIKEFITKNNGKIQIVSADGYWEMNRGAVASTTIKNELLGTIVNLAFNLSDTNSYYLKTEAAPEFVF